MTVSYFFGFRVKKWYWSIYVWFLNLVMVQAWQLYWAHHKELYRIQREEEMSQQVEEEADQRERAKERKRRRTEEKKKEEMPLLEFIRQVVEVALKQHTTPEVVHQREGHSRPSDAALEVLRYDGGPHLIKLTKVQGVCKHCKKWSYFRCVHCRVALHAECFYSFHVKEDEQEEEDE